MFEDVGFLLSGTRDLRLGMLNKHPPVQTPLQSRRCCPAVPLCGAVQERCCHSRSMHTQGIDRCNPVCCGSAARLHVQSYLLNRQLRHLHWLPVEQALQVHHCWPASECSRQQHADSNSLTEHVDSVQLLQTTTSTHPCTSAQGQHCIAASIIGTLASALRCT